MLLEGTILKIRYLSIFIFATSFALVFVFEKLFSASSNAYWLYHFLFGFGTPWLLAYAPIFCSMDRNKYSFKIGVLATAAVSLLNEYFADVFDNSNWVFSEQIIQTVSDFAGISCAFALYTFLVRQHAIKA